MSAQSIESDRPTVYAALSDASVELNRAKYAAQRLADNFSDDLGGDALSNVEVQREYEGALACLVAQLEKASESHGRAELAAQREKTPPTDSAPPRRRIAYAESAAATVTDAVQTLQGIGLRLREQESDEASAVMALVATLRDADRALGHFLAGGTTDDERAAQREVYDEMRAMQARVVRGNGTAGMTFQDWCDWWGYDPSHERAIADYRRYREGSAAASG